MAKSMQLSLPAMPADAEAVPVPPQGGYVASWCPVRVSKDNDPLYDESQKDEDTPADRARMDEGIEFETEIAGRWHEILGDRIIMIPECDRTIESKRRREELTMAAMASPGDAVVIWNCRLPAVLEDLEKGIEPRIAEPDFLVRLGQRPDGTWTWAPGDVKHHKTLEGSTKGRTWLVSTMDDPTFENAVDTNLGPGTPKVKPSKQLAHYRRVLEHYGFAADVSDGSPYWAATLGKEGVLVWRDLDEASRLHTGADGVRTRVSVQALYDEAFSGRVEVIRRARQRGNDPTLLPLVEPELKDECKGCPWRTICHDELRRTDHITLLPGMTPDRAKVHYDQGVRSADDLARLDYPTAVAVDLGLDVPALISEARLSPNPDLPVGRLLIGRNAAPAAKALAAAGVKTAADVALLDPRTAAYSGGKVWRLAQMVDQARVTKANKVHRSRGVEFVEIPRAACEIDVDIEDAGGFVYLIGARARGYKLQNGEERIRTDMHSFRTWERTPEAEAQVFAEFWEYVQGMRSKAKLQRFGLRFYHYTQHEDHAFRELAVRHAGRPGIPSVEEVEEFLSASNCWIDLYPILTTQLIWPTEQLTLKKLAGWVRFSWRDEAPGGDNSIAWHHEATENPDEAVREEYRQRILTYNEDDVIAQERIREWITRLGEARKPGTKLPGAESLDRRFRRPGLVRPVSAE